MYYFKQKNDFFYFSLLRHNKKEIPFLKKIQNTQKNHHPCKLTFSLSKFRLWLIFGKKSV